jgi:uncharacterized membrane protein
MASARSLASDQNGNAVFIAGARPAPSGLNLPLVWTLSSGSWQVRQDTLPSGVPGGWAQSINAKGQSAGMNGTGGSFALYWDSVGTAAVLSSNSATAWSINGDGTVVVGSAGGVAAMWVRTLSNGAYGPWSGDIFLDTPGNSCGGNPSSSAYAVNSAGTVAVGTSCSQPVAWNISGTTVTRFLLGTLGPPNNGSALSINNLTMPNAGGSVTQGSQTVGVIWKSF